jgi:hypothetical protein
LKAAMRGHIEILRWARSQDPPCPWDSLNILRSCAPNPVKDWVASQTPWLNWGGLNG